MQYSSSSDEEEDKHIKMATSFFGNIENYVLGDDFDVYVERMEHLLTLNKVMDDKMKVSFFISLAGNDVYKILKSLVAPKKPNEFTYKQIIESLKTNFKPKKNKTAERFKFYKKTQSLDESISDFVIELKILAETCEFDTFLDSALCDKFICGVGNEKIQARLLQEEEPTFEKVVSLAQSMELTAKEVANINKNNKDNANFCQRLNVNRVGEEQRQYLRQQRKGI